MPQDFSDFPDQSSIDPYDYFNPGSRTPGEMPSFAPPVISSYEDFPDQPRGGFMQGLWDMPSEMYHHVDELGRRGAEHIGRGEFGDAFATIFSPLSDLFRMHEGVTSPSDPASQERAKQLGVSQVLGLTGLPTQGFQEAWQASDWPRLAGQATTALGTFGLGHAVSKARSPGHSASAPVDVGPPPTRGPGVPQDWLPFESLPEGRPVDTTPSEFLRQPELPFEDPMQMDLPFGAYRSPRGRFTNMGPGYPTKTRPFLEEPLQQEFDLGMEPSPRPPAPTAPQNVSPMWQQNGQVVTLRTPDAATVEMYRNQGYVSVPGLRSPEGFVQMVRGDVAPLYVTGDKRVPPPPALAPVTRPEVPSAIGPNEMGAGDSVAVPNSRITQSFIEEIGKGGYKLVSNDGQTSIFKRLLSDDTGTFDPTRLTDELRNLAASLRRVLGRDVSPAEVRAVARTRAGMESEEIFSIPARVAEEPPVTTVPEQPNLFPPNEGAMTIASRTPTPQPSLEAISTELDNFIQHGDDAPAETRTTGATEYVQDLTNQFLSGTVDVHAVLAQLRQTVAGLEEWNRQQRPNETIPEAAPRESLRSRLENNDIREIDEAIDLVELDEIRRFWESEQTEASLDANEQTHAARMLERVNARIAESSGNRPISEPPADPFSTEPRVEVFNTHTGETIGTFLNVREAEMWIQGHPNEPLDYAQIGRGPNNEPFITDEHIAATEARHPNESFEPDDGFGTTPPTLETLRQATGVSNPPIKFGLQEPKARTRRPEISPEKVAKLEASAEPHVMKDVARRPKRAKHENERNGWDDWADSIITRESPGPPGLSIEDNSYTPHYPGQTLTYTVIYRGADGNPIVVAKVREGPDGVRKVPTLAANRFKGLATGRAVKAVGEALVDMNATEASGTISHYTGRLIARLAKLVKDDAGSFDIDQLLKSLRDIKEKVLNNGLAEPFTSVDGFANLLEKMSGGRTSFRWLASKGQELLGDESGSINIEDINNAWEGMKDKTGWSRGNAGQKKKDEVNWIKEVLAVPSAATTTLDLSAPGRQGLAMILTPQFWRAAGAMFGGLTEEGFKTIDAELQSKPIFQKKIDLQTGKVGKSFAEEIGMKLFRPASEVGPRAEAVASRWLETGGSIPYASAAYRNTLGVPVRMSNRAFITFLNHLNANRTEYLLNKARDMSIEGLDTGKVRQGIMPWKSSVTPTEAQNLNPYHNLVLGKEIADFVNTATGHGPLKTHILPHKQAEISLEAAASKLGYVLFSPRLLASRVRLLNPSTYIMATPFVRKQYAKAALSAFAAWSVFTEAAKMGGAEVGDDPTSADFGKVRIGDTRIDPGGGFLQYWVLANRFYQGGYTSSASQEFHRFGEGFSPETQGSNVQRFMSNKLNPVAKFAYDVAFASEYVPFHVKDRLAQLFVPLFAQDVITVVKEDPELAPWLVPMLFGVGTQTYGKGESVGKIIAPEDDWLATGGGIADLAPDYIHPRLDY